MKTKKLLGDVFVFGAGTFLTKLVQFLLLPLYTLYLSADAYGTGELFNNLTDLLYPVMTLCFFEAVFRFSIGSKHEDDVLVSTAARVLGFGSVVATAMCAIVVVVTHDILPALFLLLLVSYSFRQLFAFYARGCGKLKLFAASGVVNALALGLFSWVLIALLGMGAEGYLLALVLGQLCSGLFLLIGGKFWKIVHPIRRYSGKAFAEMWKYSWPLVGYNVAYWVSLMSGRYVLALFCGAATAGLYLAVNKLSAVINMVQQVFFYAFQINSSMECEGDNDFSSLGRIYRAFSASLEIFCSILLCLMPFIASLVLQGEFTVAAVYMPLALFGAFTDCMFCFFKSLYTAYKQTRRTMTINVVGAIASVALSFALVPFFEIWGVLAAVASSNVLVAAIRCADSRRFAPIDQRWRVNGPALAILLCQTIVISVWPVGGIGPAWVLFAALVAFLLVSYRGELSEIARAVRDNR